MLVLNPDCRLQPATGRLLLEELQTHPTCAVIGPRIVDADGTLQESARGDPNMLTGLFGRTTIGSRLFPRLVSGSPKPPVHVARKDALSPVTLSIGCRARACWPVAMHS